MKYIFSSLCIVGLFLLLAGCKKSNSCRSDLEQNYPEIVAYMDSLNLKERDHIVCKTTESNRNAIVLFGETETNENGIFYSDSCQFVSLTIHEFALKNSDEPDAVNIATFYAYCFSDASEQELFEDFMSSMSRKMNRDKEIHSFFNKNGKWFLYFRGMV